MLTGSPGLGQTRHGVAPDGAAQALAWGWRGGDEGPTLCRSCRAWLPFGMAPIFLRELCDTKTGNTDPRSPPRRPHASAYPISRLSEPLRTTPHTKQCQLPEEKGSVPFFKGLIVRTSHAPCLRTSTSTQENGSRWAAQRLGRRLAVCRRMEPWRRGSRSRARPSRAVLRWCSSRVVFRRAPLLSP